ncbi:MAG: hypothetical protein AAFV88_26350, partial [Planctomycetota bacterium]
YGVAAWTDDFTGWVIDYGYWPGQKSRYFEKSSAPMTLRDKYPDQAAESESAMLHVGLADLCKSILGRKYLREDGTEQAVDTCMVDANYGPEQPTIYEFCKLSPYCDKLLPSHGMATGINKPPMHAKRQQRGEIVGWNWRMPSLAKTTKTIRYINFDANEWKVFMFKRLAASRGAVGCLELPGKRPEDHV